MPHPASAGRRHTGHSSPPGAGCCLEGFAKGGAGAAGVRPRAAASPAPQETEASLQWKTAIEVLYISNRLQGLPYKAHA